MESGLQKAVKTAADRAGMLKRIGCHTFRHSFVAWPSLWGYSFTGE